MTWKKESYRHSLSGRGVATKQFPTHPQLAKVEQQLVDEVSKQTSHYNEGELNDDEVASLIQWSLEQRSFGRFVYRASAIDRENGTYINVYAAAALLTPEKLVREGIKKHLKECKKQDIIIENLEVIYPPHRENIK